MLHNQLLVLFRNALRNKRYSFLNIFGLAIGIACACFIFLWVEHELSFNHNFKKRNSLFTIKLTTVGENPTIEDCPMPLPEEIKRTIPGIKNTARFSWELKQLFILGDRSFNISGRYIDPAILSMLDLTFIYGTHPSIQSPEDIVISESMSRTLFANDNPVGKILTTKSESIFSRDGNYLITGVYKDLPVNCSYHFNWISSYTFFENLAPPELNKWNFFTETLLETEPLTDIAHINKQLKHYMAKKVEGSTLQTFLFSMNDWNLYSRFTDGKPDGGKIQYIYLFSIIAFLILVIACINFMNLSTAQSEKRAKEVGVRKVSGAGRLALIRQFIGESLVMSFLAVVLAIIMIAFAIPAFNSLVGKELHADFFNTTHLVFLFAIGLICGLLSGIYPAFYLSSFRPVMVLKGIKINNSSAAVFMRKGLVMSQFSISIMLIISTIIIYQQVQHVKSRNLGYETNNTIQLSIPNSLPAHFLAIRNELLQSGLVENVALTWSDPMYIFTSSNEYTWAGKSSNNKIEIYDMGVSPGYLATMHMKLKSGRDFYLQQVADSNSVIINESLAKLMGASGKIGAYISRKSTALRAQIVGITEDFVFNDMYAPCGPAVLLCIPRMTNLMIIRYKPGADLKAALATTDQVLKASYPGYPFEYKFVDEAFHKIFESETLVGKLSAVFSVLAIAISCLGLFGLTAYTAERRTKEIGIRKVLGASVGSLARLLSFEFLKLVCLSCIVAFPVAWWALHSWLQDYQYRTTIQWWVFVVAGLIALLIAILTVSYQAVKVAIKNPVKSLRSE
ncbi:MULTISPECIES: ABC transporter permease [Niastella]|uniref:ABC transporter permease n=1 Tax=Niastella soli TaxID=2821487 RepID=A0ABS3Z4N5_9BACT|nr:ABC transporter permease [Niastella soli]MBO9205131.1 ABC transporter permease [Niastella soli]